MKTGVLKRSHLKLSKGRVKIIFVHRKFEMTDKKQNLKILAFHLT